MTKVSSTSVFDLDCSPQCSEAYSRDALDQILAILYDGGKHAEEQPRLLGTTENALGLRDWAKEKGIEFVVSSDKEGPDSDFQRHIVDADILIT